LKSGGRKGQGEEAIPYKGNRQSPKTDKRGKEKGDTLISLGGVKRRAPPPGGKR